MIIRVRNGRVKICICSLPGVYGSAKDYMQVVKRLYLVGGKIFYGGERFYFSLTIVLWFQLIIKGRAKILLGVEFLTQPYVTRYMHV